MGGKVIDCNLFTFIVFFERSRTVAFVLHYTLSEMTPLLMLFVILKYLFYELYTGGPT